MYDSRPARRLNIAPGTAYTLSSTGVAVANYIYLEDARVWRIMAYVTTVVVSTTKTSVQVLYRPVYGSATNQVVLGTLKIGINAAADTVWYLDITPVNVAAGGQIVFNTSVAATASGAATFDVLDDYDPEQAVNESKFNIGS